MLPKLFAKKFLGIDIGTSTIRIVELESSGHGISLSNYGQVDLKLVEREKHNLSDQPAAAFSTDEIVEIIQTLLAEMKVKTRQCAFPIPDFLTFFTSFSLPSMTDKELAEAVLFEARQHIPLPMDSVTVDWQLVSGQTGKTDKMEVTVIAIPNEIIAQYKEIAAKAKLQVMLMEAETFGLAQSLVSKNEMETICLIDIGVESTACSLVEKQILRYSHSFDRGQKYLMKEFLRRLPLSREMAQMVEESYGFKLFSLIEPEIKKAVKSILHETMVPVLKEVQMALDEYQRLNGSEVAKIIVSGGIAEVEEIQNQFADYFKKKIEVAAPFKEITFPAAAVDDVTRIGPAFAVAVGMARRGLEFFDKGKTAAIIK